MCILCTIEIKLSLRRFSPFLRRVCELSIQKKVHSQNDYTSFSTGFNVSLISHQRKKRPDSDL